MSENRNVAEEVLADVFDWYQTAYPADKFSVGKLFALDDHVTSRKPIYDLWKVIAEHRRSQHTANPNNAFSELQIHTIADYIEAGSRGFRRKRWLELAGVT